MSFNVNSNSNKVLLEQDVDDIVQRYSGSYNKRDEDELLIDKKINDLLSTNLDSVDIAKLRRENCLKYYAHLSHLAGVVSSMPAKCELETDALACEFQNSESQILEGWNPTLFLPLRIGYLFRLTIALQKNEIPFNKLPELDIISSNTDEPKNEKVVSYDRYSWDPSRQGPKRNEPDDKLANLKIINELVKCLISELNVEMQTYFLTLEADKINNSMKKGNQEVQSSVPTYVTMELANLNTLSLTNHVEKIWKLILGLSENQEISYCTGYAEHAVYVSFRRELAKNSNAIKSVLVIRVDNAGLWSNNGKHLEDKLSQTVRPYVVFITDFSVLKYDEIQSKIMMYIQNLFEAKATTDDKIAEKLIYTKIFAQYEQGYAEKWFEEKQQRVGNCVVTSHDIGQRIRLNLWFMNKLEPYLWVRLQETRTSATPSPQIGLI